MLGFVSGLFFFFLQGRPLVSNLVNGKSSKTDTVGYNSVKIVNESVKILIKKIYELHKYRYKYVRI